MNEVEKMYKTIFSAFAPNCSLCTKLIGCEIINNTHNCNKFECDYERLFTAEKQLELIKWLAVKGNFDSSIDIAKNTYDYWTIYFQGVRWTAEGFEESLAGLINNLWQDLTEEERKQIKNILE